MSDIKVEVSGPVGCGKTVVLALLAKALDEVGIQYKLAYESSMAKKVVQDYIEDVKLDSSKVVNRGQNVILSERHAG